MTDKIKVIVICGPTGVGKTRSAILLARRFGGEIIGADAVQVYRLMDIGSAKPTPGEQTEVPHHLVDVADPSEPFDAARYLIMARGVVEALSARGVVPIVAGGTGLYIKALLHGLFPAPAVLAGEREKIRREMALLGPAAMHQKLRRLDPVTADRLHPNDTARILRALEVVRSTGRSITAFQEAHRFSEGPYDALKIGLFMEREALYARINQRVEEMMAEGFEEEVATLLRRGFGSDLKSMQSLGYRHVAALLEGRIDRKTCIETLKRDHRRYAKRQMTWFGADPAVEWFEPGQTEAMAERVERFLSKTG